jgi:hypothetical protein
MDLFSEREEGDSKAVDGARSNACECKDARVSWEEKWPERTLSTEDAMTFL